jgi:hypothetical protein
MTNEEWDRKTEFLLNQSAKFDAGMQELKQAQTITEKKVAETADAAKHALEVAEHALDGVAQLADITEQAITTMTAGFRASYERMNQGDEKINALIHSQMLTEESLRETDKQLQETAKQMQDTDKRLRDLTDLSERYFRKDDPGRNGSEN